MITLQNIRKVFKSSSFDPKESGTEWNISAKHMSGYAHLTRAHTLITFFLEGVKGSSCLYEAIWHLACGVYKINATIPTKEIRETGRG